MMKKISNYFCVFAVLLMAGAAFSACSSDNDEIDKQIEEKAGTGEWTMTVKLTRSNLKIPTMPTRAASERQAPAPSVSMALKRILLLIGSREKK